MYTFKFVFYDCITQTVYTELNSKRLNLKGWQRSVWLLHQAEGSLPFVDPKKFGKLPSPKRRSDRCRRDPQRRDFTGRQGWPRLGAIDKT